MSRLSSVPVIQIGMIPDEPLVSIFTGQKMHPTDFNWGYDKEYMRWG